MQRTNLATPAVAAMGQHLVLPRQAPVPMGLLQHGLQFRHLNQKKVSDQPPLPRMLSRQAQKPQPQHLSLPHLSPSLNGRCTQSSARRERAPSTGAAQSLQQRMLLCQATARPQRTTTSRKAPVKRVKVRVRRWRQQCQRPLLRRSAGCKGRIPWQQVQVRIGVAVRTAPETSPAHWRATTIETTPIFHSWKSTGLGAHRAQQPRSTMPLRSPAGDAIHLAPSWCEATSLS